MLRFGAAVANAVGWIGQKLLELIPDPVFESLDDDGDRDDARS